MNFKKLILSLILGVSMIGFAGMASAFEDINIYGSSAQFTYWTQAGPAFLTHEGCTGVECAWLDASHAIVEANCGGTEYYIRITAKASYDGICALENNYNGTNSNCTTDATSNYDRQMVSAASCTFSACTTTLPFPGTCTATADYPVTIAASDVEASSFTQSSHGLNLGPLGGPQVDKVFIGGLSVTAGGNTPYTLATCNPSPLVVPFAFYVNNSVKLVSGQTITNISRIQAVQIFGDQVYNWTDLGSQYQANLPIVVCMRAAGSGTHATLDYGVMHSAWGGSLITIASNNTNTNYTADPNLTAYFNNATGDEVNCVNGHSTWSGTGAIGYFDADYQTLNSSTTGTVTQLTFEGVRSGAYNIETGAYDNFYTNEELYYYSTDSYAGTLCTWANNYLNIPASEVDFWASGSQMEFNKTHDYSYPSYVGNTDPFSPELPN